MKKLLLTIAAATLLVSSFVITKSISTAAPVMAFEAKFETAADFYNRFDYGLSGFTPAGRGDPNTAAIEDPTETPHWMGDHDLTCSPPTAQRPVHVEGETWTNGNWYPKITHEKLFYHCAPGDDPNKGHLMTAFNTLGYGHAWFSPKQEFTKISKVCWDQNENTIGGKWLELQFIDHADATRWATGTQLNGVTATGSGGFDLGMTSPGFRVGDGPTTGIDPQSGTQAGLKWSFGIFDFWQNQNTFVTQGSGWPGFLPDHGGNNPLPYEYLNDKATRYKHCLEQVSPGQLRVTFAAPAFNGQPAKTYVRNFVGQIPQDARRVVFHDAEYDGPKRGHYRPDHLTWHWDNIQIFTDNGTTSPPTTTTLPPTTTTTTTTLPPTTTTTTTTLPPTTTTTVVPTVPVVCTEIKVVVKPDNDGVNKILSMDSNEVTCP